MACPVPPASAPRPALEVADIVRACGAQYRATHRLSIQQQRVLRAIESCRTAALGGHAAVCDHCGALEISFNSCLMGSTFLWGVRPNSIVGLSSIFADLTMQPMLSDSP